MDDVEHLSSPLQGSNT